MPVVIGGKPESDFQNPIGLLADCHRRIEQFLSVLVRLAEAGGEALSGEQRSALGTALLYFRNSAPKHTSDEEDSLFPRLRAMDRPEVKAALSKVEALEREHRVLDKAHAELDQLGQAWLAGGTLPRPAASRFSELAAELAVTYRRHIAVEEQELFPIASAALAESDRAGIGSEMARRRGLSPP